MKPDAAPTQAVDANGRRKDLMAGLLLAQAALLLAWVYVRMVEIPMYVLRADLHAQIVAAEAVSPYRYRILVPHLTEWLTSGLTLVLDRKAAFILAYGMYNVIAFGLLLFSLFWFLRRWYGCRESLAATLLLAALMPVSFFDHGFQPWSWIEAAFMTMGLVSLYQRKLAAFVIVSLLGMLNRETGIFLPMAAITLAWFSRNDAVPLGIRLRSAIAVFLACFILFFSLRYFLGMASHTSPKVIFARNILPANLGLAFANLLLLPGVLGVAAVAGYRRAPLFLRRTAVIVIPYLLVVIYFGIWKEARLWVPLAPFLLGLGLAYIQPAANAAVNLIRKEVA